MAKLHAIEQTQLRRQHRVDGVGRPNLISTQVALKDSNKMGGVTRLRVSDDARGADLPDVTCPAGVALAAAVGARVNSASGLLLLAAAPC